MAFDVKLFTHFHASYMEYSRVQTSKAHKSYKIVLSYACVIVFYCTMEILILKEPTLEFQPEMVLK